MFFVTAISRAHAIDDMGCSHNLNDGLKPPLVAQQVKENDDLETDQIENHIVFFEELTIPTMGIVVATMAMHQIIDHPYISAALCIIMGCSLIKIHSAFGHKKVAFDYAEKVFEFIADQFSSKVDRYQKQRKKRRMENCVP